MRQPKRSIWLVMFDFDGTLVDATKDIVLGVNYALSELGLRKKSPGTIVSFIGEGVDKLLEYSLGPKQMGKQKAAVRLFLRYQSGHMLDNAFLYPNVRETIDHLRDKHMAIISNRNALSCRKILEGLGMAGYFKKVLGGDEVACRKPSACPVDALVEHFGVSKEEAIVVGDMDIDVQAGKASGVLTCAVTYGLGTRTELKKAKPDYIIDDISQLKDIIL